MRFLIFLCFLGGCGPVNQSQTAGAGALGGIVATKTIQNIQKNFTPNYPLQVNPVEICALTDPENVTCVIVPCVPHGTCQRIQSRADWIAENPKILTLSSSAIPAIKLFCEKNKGACETFLGEYDGEKILVVGED